MTCRGDGGRNARGGACCEGCRANARHPGLGERYEPDVVGDVGMGAAAAAAAARPRRPGRVKGRMVAHLKGKLAEKLMTRTPTAQAAMAEARARALREGIDPAKVKFTRDVKGIHNQGPPRQLTDGVIYGTRKDGKIRIFNVFESKARSDVSDVAIRSQGDLGQLARDFERLRQLPVRIDGQIHQPERVLVSRQQTAWTVFAPKGVRPSARHRDEIRTRAGFDFRSAELPLTNDQLWARATSFANKLPQKPPRVP